jgi:predicted dehydrogenase/ribosomal protein S18 acetylase RimI-like enzyme
MIVYRIIPSYDISSISAIDRADTITARYVTSCDGLQEETVQWDVPTWSEGDVIRIISSLQPWLETTGKIFGAYDKEVLVGFAVYRSKCYDHIGPMQCGQLALLHVSEAFRGQGIGKQLIQNVIEFAANDAVTHLLVSSNCNKRTVDFYAALGFRVLSFPELQALEPDDIQMIRSLVNFKFRWCIVGTSYISGVMVDAIRASLNGEVYCVAGRSPQNVHSFAKKHGIAKIYLDYDEALSDPMVDVVYIGLPTYLHAEWVEKCARAGKHILNEKSFPINAAQTKHALDVVKECEVFCMEAQMYRCHPIIRRLKEIVCVEKLLGEVRAVDASFTAPISEMYNRRAGGSILDLGCYCMSMVRLICGEPESISGSGELLHPTDDERLKFGYNDSDRAATAVLQLPNGVVGTIRSCNDEDLNVTYIITCEYGRIELSNLWVDSIPDEIRIHPDGSEMQWELVSLPEGVNFYVLQINTVNESIQFQRMQAHYPSMTWEESISNIRALDSWRAAIGLNYSVSS